MNNLVVKALETEFKQICHEYDRVNAALESVVIGGRATTRDEINYLVQKGRELNARRERATSVVMAML